MTAGYDRIGSTYATYRRPDPRISAAIETALGDATNVLDVGAGTGSYELGTRRYVGVEPSRVMLTQRAHDAAPAVQGVAERLPFPHGTFDATMAILTVHHWPDATAGLAEVRRVTRRGDNTLDVISMYVLVPHEGSSKARRCRLGSSAWVRRRASRVGSSSGCPHR